MTVHKKLLIKWEVINQIWWSWCYYNEEKMLYPARWKKITVDQSKVLKNWVYRLFRFLWATRYRSVHGASQNQMWWSHAWCRHDGGPIKPPGGTRHSLSSIMQWASLTDVLRLPHTQHGGGISKGGGGCHCELFVLSVFFCITNDNTNEYTMIKIEITWCVTTMAKANYCWLCCRVQSIHNLHAV